MKLFSKTHRFASIALCGVAGFGILAVRAQNTRTELQTNRTQKVAPAPSGGATASELEIRLADLVRRGATMEEIAELTEPIASTPAQAIRELKAGNSRFFGGTARRSELSAAERRAQILTQTPFATVLGCSDSRVPVELVFDQGLGTMFVTRVAGNIVEPGTIGSIEYAIEHLKSHVIVVMGHEGCGAVKAALLPPDVRAGEPAGVRFLLDQIVPSIRNLPLIRDEKARLREAVIANVRLQVANMKKNPVIQRGIKEGKIAVIGAFYEITSGAVDFLETEDELRIN